MVTVFVSVTQLFVNSADAIRTTFMDLHTLFPFSYTCAARVYIPHIPCLVVVAIDDFTP